MQTLKQVAEQEEQQQELEAHERPGWSRQSTKADEKGAQAALKRLRQGVVGAEATVDLLMQCVDILPELTMPDTLPGSMGPEDDRMHEAPYLAAIGNLLLRGCADLQLKPAQVWYAWKNVKSWTEAQVDVQLKGYRLDEQTRHLMGSHESRVLIVGNFNHLKHLNTRQRLAALYNALRERDEAGKRIQAPVRVFFDQLALFGAGTFQHDVRLRRAMELGAQRELPFTLEEEEEDGGA